MADSLCQPLCPWLIPQPGVFLWYNACMIDALAYIFLLSCVFLLLWGIIKAGGL